jgi:hypothetical protein
MVHKKYSNSENCVIEIYMLSKSFTLFNLILHLFNEDCQQPIATSGFPPFLALFGCFPIILLWPYLINVISEAPTSLL